MEGQSIMEKITSAASSVLTGNAKTKQIDDAVRRDTESVLTTNEGVPLYTTDNTAKAGELGPSLLQDFHAFEKLQHFNRERIPERVVHARGVGAHGVFKCYESASDITKACVFSEKGKETPVFVRFSTVAGSRGASDTSRDVRGFAVKFYTDEGNWDLVGNNIPVFFIQDGIKFPDLIHALKPEQRTEVPQASSAHNTFWDFIGNMPESAHMIMWMTSDRAVPRSLRMMDGFGVHTFSMVNEKGEIRFVKFHWKSLQGVHSFLEEEGEEIKGREPDYHRLDLYESIEMGVYPEWELAVQVFTEEDAAKFDFEYLDGTKIVPEELVPLRRLGKMTLNRNVLNFFAETEQVVFCPANIIRGIGFTNDPMLQSRVMAYKDAGLYRVGTNYQRLPINKPVCPFHNNQRDGAMTTDVVVNASNYHPNSLAGNAPAPSADKGFEHTRFECYGKINMERAKAFANHFTQATLFYNSMSDIEKLHITKALVGQLNKVTHTEIKERVINEIINNIDHSLAVNVANQIGINPPTVKTSNHGMKSAYLSQFANIVNYCGGRKIVCAAVEGFDYASWQSVQARLLSRTARAFLLGPNKSLKDNKNVQQTLDYTLEGSSMCLFDGLIILNGGEGGDTETNNASASTYYSKMSENGTLKGWIAQAYKHLKPIAAIGPDSVKMLTACGIDSIKISQDDHVAVEHGVVTVGKTPKSLNECIDAFCEGLSMHRAWNRPNTDTVPAI